MSMGELQKNIGWAAKSWFWGLIMGCGGFAQNVGGPQSSALYRSPHVNEFVTSVIELVSSRTVESVGLDAESCAVFAKCL